MRVKVGKQSRKALQYYKINFHFKEPYKVLLDGNFVKVCIDKKIELKTKIEKTLNGRVILAMTPCILEELRLLGENFRGIYVAARRFPKEKCKHTGTVIPSECLKLLIGTDNPEKVLVASQDQELVNTLRRIPGVPVVQLIEGKITLHEPIDEVKEQMEKEIKERGNVTERERKIIRPVIKKMKEDARLQVRNKLKKQRNALGIKIKKKAKNPNPLSQRGGKSKGGNQQGGKRFKEIPPPK